MKKKSLFYSDVGININEIKNSHKSIGKILSKTFKYRDGLRGSVVGEIGHYAALVNIGYNYLLALHTDGVGTKVIIAQMMDKFDTIGIDCIAMNVNDVICIGAEPVSFLDYIALDKLDQNMIEDVMKGLVLGANEASVSIIGGETAILPDIICGNYSNSFDLVGTVLGIVEKNNLVTGNNITKDNSIIGVESSGIHSNGLTLARNVLLSKYNINDKITHLNSTLGNILLKPTRIYVKPIMEIFNSKIKVNGLAHITGGGFSKLTRLIKNKELGFNIDNLPKIPDIFKIIQKEGNIKNIEMFRTFNMGVGFCVIAEDKEVNKIIDIFNKHRMNAFKIGKIVSNSGVFINKQKIC